MTKTQSQSMDKNLGKVVIVGAGPAGTRVAEVFISKNIRPVVIDESPASGGQVYRRQPTEFKRSAKERYGFEANKATNLHKCFDRLKNSIDYYPDTTVWGVEGNVLFTQDAEGIKRVSYDTLFLCTGAADRVIPFHGWTLPGIYTMGGAQIALKAQGCVIGRDVVFMGSGPLLYLVAYQYVHAGANVKAVLDTAKLSDAISVWYGLLAGGRTLAKGIWYQNWLRLKGIPIKRGIKPISAVGEGRVSRINYLSSKNKSKFVDCDAIGFGWGVKPECQLAELAGCEMRFDEIAQQWLPVVDNAGRTSLQDVYLAGDGAGVMGADAAEYGGELAALTALSDSGASINLERYGRLQGRLKRLAKFRIALEKALPYPEGMAASLVDSTIVCRCEGITAGEIRQSQSLVPQEMNRAKAYTRVGMGRCQGRMCGIAAAEILAKEKGVTVSAVGRMRGQAPIKPLHIGKAGEAAREDPNRAASI